MLSSLAYWIYKIGPWVISILLARLSCKCWFGTTFIDDAKGIKKDRVKSKLLVLGIYIWVLMPYVKEGLTAILTATAILSALVTVVWVITLRDTDCFVEWSATGMKTILEVLSKDEVGVCERTILSRSEGKVKDYNIGLYLEEMEKSELIKFDDLDSENNKLYKITEEGKKHLQALSIGLNKLKEVRQRASN